MADLDSPNHFYLGREHDLATGKTSDTSVLYKSTQLTTHAVCVGMTGSGKTGLCLSLLEEAALDGVPAICIDPKGDLGNLLLAFDDLAPERFGEWLDDSAVQRSGAPREEVAAKTAALWREGLAAWGETPERVARYNASVERLIFTPGASHGLPMTVLKSFDAPPAALRADADAFRDRVQSAVSGLLALLGIDADPVRSREHIFLSNLLTSAWNAGRDLSVADMIREIQAPPFQTVGVMELETFYPAKDRTALAMDLNNLLASPSFAGWMTGQPLDVQQLFYSPEGKPRHSIVSIAHLDDTQRMFFVTILLSEVLAWMRTQPGTGNLRALLYMDEVFGFFPPSKNPPSKPPMLTLLKQARAFGLGVVLATQNPVDLDYKGLSNAGTWFLGRLQTERDKMRVMEGLEGASAAAGSTFDKGRMEETLAALGNRVFLMNNVHEDRPRVFHTRWAMSYLAGPLSRQQIQKLMDPVRGRFAGVESRDTETGAPNAPADAQPRATAPAPAGVARFVETVDRVPKGGAIEYRPGLWGVGKLHFVKSSGGVEVDCWRDAHVVKCFNERVPDGLWEGAIVYDRAPVTRADAEFADATFAETPREFAGVAESKRTAAELTDWLYQTQRVQLWRCAGLDATSRLGESEGEFRGRLAADAERVARVERREVEADYEKKLSRAEEAVAKKRAYYEQQKSQFWGKLLGVGLKVFELVVAVLGGKATGRRASSSVSSASQATTERSQASRAKAACEEAEAELDALRAERDDKLAAVDAKHKPEGLALETIAVTPRKSDIDVDAVTPVWLPHRVESDGRAVPAY